MAKYNYYSIRLLNPFQGILQIVRSDSSRALSSDGTTWRLQIHSDLEHIPRVLVDSHHDTNAFKLYGLWTQRDGITRLPLHPDVDPKRASLAASTLVSALETLPEQPFALQDRFELWLLNKDNDLPLALLASACSPDNLPSTLELLWSPSLPG